MMCIMRRILRPYRLRRARADRERAQDACNRAWARGDMRGYNAAHKALVSATLAVMRLELGR